MSEMMGERWPGEDVHDLGSKEKTVVDLQEQIENLERDLDDMSLNPEQIRAKKAELMQLREQYRALNS